MFDIFISYRRDGGEILGRLMFEILNDDYSVFFDHESLTSGRFDTKLLDHIASCKDFLVILSRNCFERTKTSQADDWFYREISHAILHDKNIIPIFMEDFKMPTEKELAEYPKEIQTLLQYNGYTLQISYIDSVIAKLRNNLRAPLLSKKDAVTNPDFWHRFVTYLATPAAQTNMPASVLQDIYHGAVNAIMGQDKGQVYNGFLDTGIKAGCNIRHKFRYEIEIGGSFSFSDIDTSEEKYFSLSETLAYQKQFLTGGLEDDFWLGFITDLDKLDGALKNQSFLFSENLLIEQEDFDKLLALDEDERIDFYLHDMRVKININGTVLKPVSIRMDESGIFAQYHTPDECRRDVIDVKIRFSIPQNKNSNYFFVSLGDPTYSPSIRFSYPEDELFVQMIPFMNRSVTGEDTKIFDGLREVAIDKEWILPVSGVVFVMSKLSE